MCPQQPAEWDCERGGYWRHSRDEQRWAFSRDVVVLALTIGRPRRRICCVELGCRYIYACVVGYLVSYSAADDVREEAAYSLMKDHLPQGHGRRTSTSASNG